MTPLNLDPNQNYLTPYTPPVDIPEWRKSLGSFAKETSALGSGLVALGAQAFGAEDMRDSALADYQQSMQEAGSGWMAPEVGQIEDIKLTEQGGVGRLGSYLGYQVPKGIAQLGSLVIGGLGTGAVAKAAASKGIKELAKTEMKNLAADVAKKAVVAPLVERAAGQEAIKQLAKRQILGTQVGVGAGALGMETGQMYGKLATDQEVGPEKAVLPAVTYGGIAATLEYLPLHMAGQALGLDRLLLRKVIKADPGLAAQAAELSLKQKALKVVSKAGKGAAAGAAVEGITEGMQNLVEQAATKYAQEDPQWASVLPTTKEGWSDFWNNVAAGAAVGGVAGAALGPMAQQRAQKPIPPTGEVNVPQAEAEAALAGAGVPTNPQQPQGPAPAEAPAPTPGAAAAEGIAGGPQGGETVVNTTSPQPGTASTIPTLEPSDAQRVTSPSPVYEHVPSPREQGGQEVQVPAQEGSERVLSGGQEEVREVIGKANGKPFASRDAATRKLNQLWAQGQMQIQEGPEAGKQARARVAKQGDGYVIERLESFAGPRAFTADTNALSQAKQIAATKGAEVARQETGWFQGEDQKWRFELDDSQAKLKPRVFKPTAIADREISVAEAPLGNLLDHKALRAAYPQFVSIPTRIVIDPTKKTVRGYYEHSRGNSALVVYAPSEKQAVQGLMHEVQHAIQREEGFAPGTGPEQFDAVALQKKYKKEYAELDETLVESKAEAEKAYAAGDTETLELIKELRRGVMAAQKELRELMASPMKMQHKEYMQAPGEREARNVEARLGMSAEERRQTPPRETVPEGWVDRLESREAPPLDTDSTGKLVHPTPEGRANFKKWFAGSKVVDAEGRPLRVYRGDKDSSFNEFKTESLGQNTKTLGSKLGFFFTPDYAFAASPQFGGSVRHFYLSAKSPYLVPVSDGQLEADARLQGYKEFNVDSEELLRKKLVDAGYDSIMYAGYQPNQHIELIVIDPTAIKSIRNRGTFEQGNLNILESRTSAPTQSTTDFVSQTDSVLGQGWTQRAIDAGILVVNETSPADSASGYFEPSTGKFVVNLDRTPQGQSPINVLLHEGSHAGMARMLGGQFASFHKDLETLAERGSATARLAILQATEGAIGNINRQRARFGAEPFPHRLGDETLPVAERTNELKRVRDLINEQNPGLLPEEDLAYYIQLASAKSPAEAGFWRRLLAAIQAWAAQTNFGKALATIGWRPELSPQLAVELAKQAAQATLRRAELVNTLVGERAKVLRGLPAGAQLGLLEMGMESRASTISPSWWRSGVATAVAAAPQQKAAPVQWLGWLKNQPGVKQEEIEDLGLEDWLLAQEGSVTKGEVEGFVRDGGVRIEEVLHGAGGPMAYRVKRDLNSGDFDVVETLTGRIHDTYVNEQDAFAAAQSLRESGDAKFTSYQTPGGENYRELLITVPVSKPLEMRKRFSLYENNELVSQGDEVAANRWRQQGATDIREELVPDKDKTPEGVYRSGHWNEPNVLVHIRFNERQDAQGKRVLFVEEVQSDWGQEGRKRGYRSDVAGVPAELTLAADAAEQKYFEVKQQLGDLFEQNNIPRRMTTDFADTGLLAIIPGQPGVTYADFLSSAQASELGANFLQTRQEHLGLEGQIRDIEEKSRTAVPDMPLKSAWPLLGMKRAIRWAAEHGFDKVAWTPGDVQAERYDLSKQVDSIIIGKDERGYKVLAEKNDQTMFERFGLTEAQLEEAVGKDLTKKAVDDLAADGGSQRYEGLDLKVGGEGMRGFYDKMLPSMMNKYGKKFGAKVGETTVAKDRPGYDVVRVSDGASMATIGSLEGATGEARLLTESTGQEHIARPNPTSNQAVWSLPITPALRDEALTGQLLYSLPPMSTWELPHSWFTSPVSTYPEDFNTPGTFNKVFHGMVDRFHYVKEKSPELYRAFDEWKNRQGALQQEIQRTYLDPLRHWVSRYQPPPSDSEPIRRTEIAHGTATPATQYTTVEIVGHQLAARHILEDNVTEQLALKASPAFLKELKKQLSPTNVGLLNADIKLETQGSLAISKLTNDQARMLFEKYLPSADPKSDIGQRWALYNRRSAGYSIATPGSTEAQEDAVDGFINAHELYTPQIAGRETFQKITELSDKLAAHQLAMLQEGGLLQQADVDRLSRAYPHFVPLRREAFDYDRELADMFEKPRANIGKLMTRDGSTEFASAVHVLQNHLAAGFTSASAAARNQMMNKFYDVLNADRDGWKPWFRISEKRDNNGAMGLIRNGKTLYLVPADGNIRAASIARVITGRDAEQLSGPFRVMRSINNWIRWSNVSASPAFMLANTPRDYLTAVYNLQATEAAQYAKEIASWTNYKESFKALKKVIVDGVRETADPEVQSWIDLVEDFEKSGGKTSFVEALRAMDGDSWRSFEAQVGRREGKHGAVVEYGREKLEWLENLNITLENVMRLSTYKVMRDKIGKERAAEIARNLTTNFTRRGAHIDAINTWWLFYNATVQGNWQVVQNLFLNPNKAGQRRLQKAVAGTILFAFMIDQLGRAFSDDEDDDGISDWDSRPAHEKERKISSPFKIGGIYPSIPAPWVFNIFWRMGGMLGEVKDGVLKPQDAVMDSIALTTSAMNPIGSGTAAQMVSPSAFDPFMQMIENRDFMGNPLGPDGYPGASKRPDAYLAWDSTPKGFKSAAQFVNEITGGSAVESGKVDLRPSSYKVMADFLLGGLGRFGADIGEGLGILPGDHFLEREGLKDVPGAKVFLSAPSDSTAISLYHDRAAQVLGSERLVKFYSEGSEKNPQKLAEVQQGRAALLRMVPQIEDTERQIKSLRKTLRSAQARGDSRTEETLRERIVQLQKRFNQSYSRRVGN